MPQCENCEAREKHFSLVVLLQGNNLFCGWKQGISWGEKLTEKGSVKQATLLVANQNAEIEHTRSVLKMFNALSCFQMCEHVDQVIFSVAEFVYFFMLMFQNHIIIYQF